MPYNPYTRDEFDISVNGYGVSTGSGMRELTAFIFNITDGLPAFDPDKITMFNAFRNGEKIECSLGEFSESRDAVSYGVGKTLYTFNLKPRLNEPGQYILGGIYDSVPFSFSIELHAENTKRCAAPCEANTYDEFLAALKCLCRTITVKDGFDIAGDFAAIQRNKTVVIERDVTVTVSTQNFMIYGQIVNRGEIAVTGRICFYEESRDIGMISTRQGGEISMFAMPTMDNISKYLLSDTIFTSMSSVPSQEMVLVICSDITIPKGKKLRLNRYVLLEVAEGVTLTVEGEVIMYNQPLIKGSVIGHITVER
jgi:hypothetical protein